MSSAPLSATELAGMIDHTLLTPEATHNDVAKLVACLLYTSPSPRD